MRARILIFSAACLWALAGGSMALADAHEAPSDPASAASPSETGEEPVAPLPEGSGSLQYEAGVGFDPDRYPSLDVPTKPWAYDTGYFFGLTRGLDDEHMSDNGRRASYVGTIPLDVVGLPAAAIAGLFGS